MTMSFFQRWIIRRVLGVVGHPRIVLSLVAITLVICTSLAMFRLSISTQQDELFSSKPVFFHDYLEFVKRFPENDAVYVVLEPKDAAATPPADQWAKAADSITAKIKALTDVVQDAYCKVPLQQLGRQGLLFEDAKLIPAELDDARTQLAPLAGLFGQAPGLGERLVGSTPIERFVTGLRIQFPSLKPADAGNAVDFVKRLADSWCLTAGSPNVPISIGNGIPDLRKDAATDPQRLGYFYVRNEMDPRQHRILIQVYKKPVFNSLEAVTKQVQAIRDAANKAVADFPQFRIGVTGRPTLDSDQMAATNRDSHKAESVALIVVFIGMALLLRSIRLAVFAEIALGVGIGWTFGWATLSIGRLNLLSLVFMIALIGIGMDYLVQILARYRAEAARRSDPRMIWVRVFRHVGPPINTACLGAAGAFLMSIFTDFRGAGELGVIAGGGLLLCLCAGYIILPALLTLLPPKRQPTPQEPVPRQPLPPVKRGWVQLVLPILWICCLAGASKYIARASFDPGLIDLQVPNLESVKLIHTLQTWEAVVVSKDTDQLRKVRSVVSGLPVVASTDSVLNVQDNAAWLHMHAGDIPKINWTQPDHVTPADLNAIAGKSRALADLFAPSNSSDSAIANDSQRSAGALLRVFANSIDHLDPNQQALVADRLSAWQIIFAGELHDLLNQFSPDNLDINLVPPELRGHYRSADGYFALYIYPKKDLWNDTNLKEFETTVEQAVASLPDAPHVTGIASDLYHTTSSIRSAFIRSTVYALGLIVVLVFLDFRRLLPTLAAVSVLALGLPMLLALMGLFNVSWNFANFFGLPILIGAGHEYGVFMVHRFEEARRSPTHSWRRFDVADRALLLCAFITTSSFGFFWLLASHRGLKSLGLVMALGIGCIYLATLCVLRPILRWILSTNDVAQACSLQATGKE